MGTGPDVRKSPNGDDAFTVTNSLIGRNNGTGLTATGTTPGLNGNLIGGDIPGAAINPQLGPLASNGGPTQTHALLINSPAFIAAALLWPSMQQMAAHRSTTINAEPVSLAYCSASSIWEPLNPPCSIPRKARPERMPSS